MTMRNAFEGLSTEAMQQMMLVLLAEIAEKLPRVDANDRVMTNGGTIWWARSGTVVNISGNHNFGTLYMNGKTNTNGRATWLWRDLYWARRTVMLRDGSLGGDPGYVKVKWQPSSTVGTYYSRTHQVIRLKGGDVTSPDTVVPS